MSESGYLVKSGDIKDFANKVIKLAKNDSLRMDMGNKSYSSASRFLPEPIGEKWSVLFDNLINIDKSY